MALLNELMERDCGQHQYELESEMFDDYVRDQYGINPEVLACIAKMIQSDGDIYVRRTADCFEICKGNRLLNGLFLIENNEIIMNED